jgi:tetratricopeptide (TPR) repeat protein
MRAGHSAGSRVLVGALGLASAIALSAAGDLRAAKRGTEAGRTSSPGASAETQLSSDAFKALDTFEAHTLSKADTAFAKRDYKVAFTLYEEFVVTFERSKALPYAVLRKARCLHLLDKRYDAIRWYKEVLDYWPNQAEFAAPAKFHIGQCHWQNGDEEAAMKTWAELAEDPDYSKHPLAAPAINHLADYTAGQKRAADKALAYYTQVALDFRRTNPEASRYAMGPAIEHHVRTSPNEAKLREFYEKMGTFEHYPRRIKGDLATSREYWDVVRNAVKRHGQFAADQGQLRELYYAYWAKALDGKFPDDDDYQVDLAQFRLLADNNVDAWMKRLDQQFEKYQKPGDFGRIVKWMGLYAAEKAKALDYYRKLDFDRMKQPEIESLMYVFYDSLDKPDMGKNTFYKLKLDEMADSKKSKLVQYFQMKDEDPVRTLCRHFQDAELGQMELLRYLSAAKKYEEGLALADQVAAVPRFSAEALTLKAGMYESLKAWPQALACWQQVNRPPETSYRIATCYFQMSKLDQAVAELRQVENYFPDQAPEACLRIAFFYDKAGVRDTSIRVFREVMNKYPKSAQSSRAHVELEKRGVAVIRGGEDAEE